MSWLSNVFTNPTLEVSREGESLRDTLSDHKLTISFPFTAQLCSPSGTKAVTATFTNLSEILPRKVSRLAMAWCAFQ